MKTVPQQTEEDFLLVKQYVLLPILLDVLERDINVLGTVRLKMPEVYINHLRQVQDQTHKDLVRIRNRLKTRGIRVYEENRTANGIEALYLCRGYHRKLSMLWSVVKSDIERGLTRYLQN
ncbi:MULTISPECIES: hypothetical protein [unclassified Paenibacillus]|uniref:hypothetical protein n=1 Tax=unclassified Paenibacillus TaxID=185978 RepID=UPI001C116066|nr:MULTISPECIES: hypothetical protein [unclassified Paenibacillus]MBU5444234.1 hypothetical protein [Paenibacillus sp. MSJ-34]CAH0120130.1 hypothetical protein PAE9249_02643 [Paenibacillus sp. CECT 9249]